MRPRKLRADEAKLWGRIAASAKPYHPEVMEVAVLDAPPPIEPKKAPVSGRPIHITAIKPVKAVTTISAPPQVAEVSGHKTVRRGKMAIDGQIDLHGMRQHEAQLALSAVIARTRANGGRCVLVVTGKGRAIDPGEDYITPQPGVIRRRLPEWLNHETMRAHVAGYSSAHPRHGGTGAYYVLLKTRAAK